MKNEPSQTGFIFFPTAFFSFTAMSFCVAAVRRVLDFVKFVHTAYFVNSKYSSQFKQTQFISTATVIQNLIQTANYVATGFINIMRPLLGEAFNKVQIFGTNSARWVPLLLKQIPQSQLPQWYGGTKDFKPLKVYG